jgi:hypothetical protein
MATSFHRWNDGSMAAFRTAVSTPSTRDVTEARYVARGVGASSIAAEVDRPRLIEELHAAHARWGTLHAQLYWMLQHDLTGDFDPNSAYPNHLDRMRRDGPSVEALRAQTLSTLTKNSPLAAIGKPAALSALCQARPHRSPA